VEEAAPAGPGPGSFAGRLGSLAAFLAPLAFLALVLPASVHEVPGHGGAALLLGGEFRGFEVHLDGMGRACASLQVPGPPCPGSSAGPSRAPSPSPSSSCSGRACAGPEWPPHLRRASISAALARTRKVRFQRVR
jgi:hypothetical protein